jgi:hypothetical protein
MSDDRSASRSKFFRVRNAIAARARASVAIDGHRIRATAENETLIEIMHEAEAQQAYDEAVQSRLAA